MASFFWILLSIVVFAVSLILTVIILIQDSKDTGLTSAFGGGGGSALMGARMQKDLAKLTAILAAILAISLFIMGFLTISIQGESAADNATPIPAAGPEIPGLPLDEGGLPPIEGEPAAGKTDAKESDSAPEGVTPSVPPKKEDTKAAPAIGEPKTSGSTIAPKTEPTPEGGAEGNEKPAGEGESGSS